MTANKWCCLDKNTSLTALTTLEYPRIAYRSGFDDKGYVTWNKKRFETDQNLVGVSGYFIPWNESTLGILIGIAAFNGSNSSFSVGQVYPSNAAATSNSTYFDNSGNNGPPLQIYEDYTDANNIFQHTAYTENAPGQERPSIAISPDGRIWLGFYKAVYIKDDHDCDEEDYYWAGDESPLAWFMLGSGQCSIGGSAPHTTFSNFYAQIVDQQAVPGYWDIKRGYLYMKDNNTARFDPRNCNNGVNLGTYSAIPFQPNADFDFDAAIGPSVQIVCDQPLTCTPSYHVGYFYIYGDKSYVPYSSLPTPKTSLGFYSGLMPGTQTFLNTGASNAAQYIVSGLSLGNPDLLETNQSTGQNVRFFPTLKYVNVNDGVFNKKPTDGSTSFPPSYFALSYISAYRNATNSTAGTSHFEWAKNVSAISFDSKSFKIVDHSTPTPNTFTFLRDAEDATTTGGDVTTTNWGSKVDICGEYGNFDVHPIWHDIKNSTNGNLLTNTGGAILVKAYLNPSFPNDPNALPEQAFFSEGVVGTGIPTPTWGPYAYFNFNSTGRPFSDNTPTTAIEAVSSYTDNINLTGTYTFDDFYPQNKIPSSGTMPNGLYYGKYNNNNYTQPDLGILGWSSQRKLVTTGQIVHSVFENPNNNTVWYAMNSGPFLQSTTLQNWWQKIALPTSSSLGQMAPSIAVYEQGDANGFNGIAAIAATWTEWEQIGTQDNIPIYHYKVMFKTREFNICSGVWGNWSTANLVYEFADKREQDEGLEDGNDYSPSAFPSHFQPPLPVISPIVTPQTGNPLTTNLLGWTVTWNQDQIWGANTFNNFSLADDIHGGHSLCSRSWMRQHTANSSVITDNSEWGTFYNIPSYPAKFEPSGNNTANILYTNTFEGADYHHPSVVNKENKFAASQAIPDQGDVLGNNFSQSLAVEISELIWVSDFSYRRLSSPIGSLIQGYSAWPFPITHYTLYPEVCSQISDNNPCTTINSSGQQFVAWERIMDNSCQNFFISSIMTANSLPGGNWVNQNLIKNTFTMWSSGVRDHQFHWLRNPSITGAPKSKLKNTSDPITDQDLGGVEISFWQEDLFAQLNINNVWTKHYQEAPSLTGVGQWDVVTTPDLHYWGRWPQRSFGTFNEGYHNSVGHSYSIGNDINNSLAFTIGTIGSFKGTFDAQLPYQLYRGELHVKDSISTRFVWGNVYVGDSSSGQPFRQVMLYNGVDSAGYVSHSAQRDSIFRTEVFTINSGEKVNYFRSLYYPCCGYWPGVHETFRTELVHQNNSIDTLEQLIFDPSSGKFIDQMRTWTTPSNITEDVFIRVRDSIIGFSDADSLCEFQVESMFGEYPTVRDTVVSYKISQDGKIERNSLNVTAPFPNPLLKGNHIISCDAAFINGYPIKAEIVDELGRQSYSPIEITATGDWQKLILTVPNISGTYYIKISAGAQIKLFPFIVTK